MNTKIEAIYYLMSDARRNDSGDYSEENLRESVKMYGTILLDRPIEESEIEEIMENR